MAKTLTIKNKQPALEAIVTALAVEQPEGQIKEGKETEEKRPTSSFSPKIIGAIADEVSKALLNRWPTMPTRKRSTKAKKAKKIENAIFLDTSAIIDGRIFDVIYLGLLSGTVVIIDSILLELKHIADSQDTVKRERGRKGLEALEKLRKSKKLKVTILSAEDEKPFQKGKEVDEHLIKIAKFHKGRVITCDYNLEKKGSIEGVATINMNALANSLKVIAVPGEALHIKVSHQGKEAMQGVGYLDDGTMIVVEQGSTEIGKAIDVVVARVIQTATGRILFAKQI
jgi:uncharacterized protein YacL